MVGNLFGLGELEPLWCAGLGTFLISISIRSICTQITMRTALKNIFHRATRHYLSARTPPSARRRPSPNVESLEPRYALDAVPFAEIVSPISNPLIGEEVNYTVRFDNKAVSPSDIGYSPFIDIVMPKTGDASTQVSQKTVDNGISFKPGTAKL